jgi:hypothetical protein
MFVPWRFYHTNVKMLMAKHYTENDLLLYLYGEMEATEVQQLESALLTNKTLSQSLAHLKAGMAVMDQLEAEPSPTSVALILEYSEKTARSTVEEV